MRCDCTDDSCNGRLLSAVSVTLQTYSPRLNAVIVLQDPDTESK